MTSIQKDLLREILVLFDKAEADMKKVERLSSSLSIPSVNELRYVGYHLTRALCAEEGDGSFDDALDKATRHGKRAVYDAHEIGIIYLLERIQLFKDNYAKSSNVISIIPTYISDQKKAREAQEMLAKVKSLSDPDDRDQYYNDCIPHYDALYEINDTFDLARPEINKLDKKDRTRIMLLWIGLLFSLVLVVNVLTKTFHHLQP